MRLSPEYQRVIKDSARKIFGSSATVAVFGSRVDDDARGGDIDLYLEIEPVKSARQRLQRELQFYALLQKTLGEQRIDLVLHEKGQVLRPIDNQARETGLML